MWPVLKLGQRQYVFSSVIKVFSTFSMEDQGYPHLLCNTWNVLEKEKDGGFDSRDVSFSICVTKHLNLARIQAISKRCICICLGFSDCNRWIFHLRWEAADPGIRGEENWGWVGRKVEMWAAGACSCEVPGHRDGNVRSGEGTQLPKRAGIPGTGAQGSGRRLQHLEQGHRPEPAQPGGRSGSGRLLLS